jgi:hypothetical protein
MAESYSDEDVLAMYVGAIAEDDRVWVKTARRLMRERDKARRVAKVLAGPAKHLKVLGHDLTADELKAIDTALAYPEGK